MSPVENVVQLSQKMMSFVPAAEQNLAIRVLEV
jgi:hypothetical protein